MTVLNVQGSWRSNREDHESTRNDFRMILMDRGVYDGGFNIKPKLDDDGAGKPPRRAVEE